MTKYFVDNIATAELSRESVRGGAVTVFARTVLAIGQIGSVLFLSRLLTPEDYGLVAMVMAVTGFAPLFVDLGTRDAVVQRVQITEGEVSAVFWLTVTIGCTFAVIIASSGPAIARFYGEPRLVMIAVVSSLNFVVVALINQHQALMRRALMFRQLAMIEVGGNLCSAFLAIVMAFHGFGYWALVTRSLAAYCFIAIGVWWCCPWIPGRPDFTRGVREMIKFGVNITISALCEFGGKNTDRVVIGRSLGARTLGYYQQALFIYYNLFDVFVLTLHQVAVVSLSKLQNDLVEFRRCWAKALSAVSFYTMPVFGLLAVTSQDIIVILLGKRWASAGAILSILALRGIPHTVERTVGWLYLSTGRTDRCVRYNVFAAAVQIVALFCGLPFGVMGIAVSYTISMFALFLPAVIYAGHPIQIRVTDIIRSVGPQLTGSLIAAGLGFALRYSALSNFNNLTKAFLAGAAYIAFYLIIVMGIFKLWAPLNLLGSIMRDFIPTRWLRVIEEHS